MGQPIVIADTPTYRSEFIMKHGTVMLTADYDKFKREASIVLTDGVTTVSMVIPYMCYVEVSSLSGNNVIKV